MHIGFSRMLLPCLLVVSLAGMSPAARPVGGTIAGPQLGFPRETTPSRVDLVLKFMQTQLTFVSGSYVNEWTRQYFQCPTGTLTKFIKLLQISGLDCRVQFAHQPDSNHTFALQENASSHEKVVVINLSWPGLKLEELVLEAFSRDESAGKESAGNGPEPERDHR
ncbi:MAG: hypothetical protein LR011_10250 [Verrucomicrobia bacterium]|nr:hypothetical protein [Verrucomicrobiota bacterium]